MRLVTPPFILAAFAVAAAALANGRYGETVEGAVWGPLKFQFASAFSKML